MFECKTRTLNLVVVFCTVSVLLSASLNACGLPAASATSPSTDKDHVVVTLTWDEWQDVSNCVRFAAEDIGFTLEVAEAKLDTYTTAEARATVTRLTQLGQKLDGAAQDSSAGMSASELEAILDVQLSRTQQFTDLQNRLFDARMDALVSP